jgi:methylenetetrahydrofolate/methylenetetrahydromethanopterin dehydrogenase (NADP+)
MDKPSILVQLDTDPLPSAFDRVVAVDAGVAHTFSYGGVTPENVTPLVHGCIFTRGGKDLARTAIFVGGSDVTAGEAVLAAVRKALIPQYGLSVSVLLDSNGANTTAAAAVRAAGRHLDLSKTTALVLGGTGPVGQRVVRLLAKAGGAVRVGSRQKDRAEAVCARVLAHVPGAHAEAVSVGSSADAPDALDGCSLVVAAGAAGAVLLPKRHRAGASALRGHRGRGTERQGHRPRRPLVLRRARRRRHQDEGSQARDCEAVREQHVGIGRRRSVQSGAPVAVIPSRPVFAYE